MAGKTKFVTETQFIVIGRRFGSELVATEANDAVGRWRRDVVPLEAYGHGQEGLEAFVADVKTHEALLGARPDAVAEKRSAVAERDQHVSLAWAWVDKVRNTLGVRARSDSRLSNALAAALPSDDAALNGSIRALATLLDENKDRLPAGARVVDRLGEVEGLCEGLQKLPAAVRTSKGQTTVDTAQIDLMDGKLWVCIRDLNAAGRAAIRNGDLRANIGEYGFHHLKHSGNPAPAPVPAPKPATPTA